MKPLINLKSFLAVLLILIVPAALLVAYFRNYSPEAGGHEHSEMAKHGGAAMKMDGDKSGMKSGDDSHAAMGHGNMTKDGDMSAMKSGGEDHAAMGHGNMAKPQGEQTQPAETSQPPAAQPQKEGGHAAMGHGNMAPPATTQAQPQPAPATPPPGAEPMQEGMNAMGRVKDLTGGGKGTEVASHLFHAGATDFFLDHTQHITLSAEQQKRLNQIKEQALLDKASANRKVQEAEQQLWKSTSADRPDVEEIETKVRQVEQLRADQRIGFIRAVDQAAKVLTEEQTKILLGTAASVMPDMPAAKPEAKTPQKHEHH